MPISKDARLAQQAAHIGRLLEKFGNPQEWEFTGEVTEHPAGPLGATMQCSCGHGITQAFWWQRKDDPEGKKKLPTGCVCVEQLPGIEPGELAKLQAEIRRIEERKAEAKKKAKAASDTELVQACLRTVRETLEARCAGIEARRAEGQWLGPEEYDRLQACRTERGELAKAGKLKTPSAQLKALSKSAYRLTGTMPPAACDATSERKTRAWIESSEGQACFSELSRLTLEAQRKLREAPPDTTAPGTLYGSWTDEQRSIRSMRYGLESAISDARDITPTDLLFRSKDGADARKRVEVAITRLGGSGCARR